MGEREAAHKDEMNNMNQEHYTQLQAKVIKIEEDQNHFNVENDYTVKSFEDKIKELNEKYQTQIRDMKNAHSKELRTLDAEKTTREREHLDATKRAQDQQDEDMQTKEEEMRVSFDNYTE